MRYFIGLFTGLLIAAGIYSGLFFLSLGKTDSNNAASIASWYQHKDAVAEKLASPKIVIISGSNTLYGIRARKIEEVTGIPTVNFGTHAALSRDYILNRPKRNLRPGDTVILALEYELYFPNEVNEMQSDYVLGADPDYFFELPVGEQIFWAASASFPKIWERTSASKKQRDKLAAKFRLKVAEQLNDRGDFIANASENQPPDAKQLISQLPPSNALLHRDWKQSDEAWLEIGSFVDWCKNRHINVLATFPNTIHFKEYDTGKVAEVEAYLLKRYADLNVPTLGTPFDCMFPADDFFDTVYHLNQDGSLKRTAQLLEFLSPHLEGIRANRGAAEKR